MTLQDVTFPAMGCEIRLVIDERGGGAPPAILAIEEARRFIVDFESALSRFREDSELCALNRDPRSVVPASVLLRRAIRAGLWSAQRTDGLVDPTLVRALESAGYARSRVGVPAASLADALAAAPPRRPARPNPERAWTRVEIEDRYGVIRRPPGVEFDTGGSGKGLAADLLADRLAPYRRFVVDCGGDIRVGGSAIAREPFEIHVEHPMTGKRPFVVRVAGSGVATSGVNVRLWAREGGGFAHHLLDPSTGEPAWTGLIGVTALGATALEAETLSKAALLSGPARGRAFLAERGGVLVHDSGRTELVGPLVPSVRVESMPAPIAMGARR